MKFSDGWMVVLTVWVVALISAVTANHDSPLVNRDADARSFTLRVEDGQGHGGSGVAWATGSVLTAAHVINQDLSEYTVRLGDEEWTPFAARYIAERDAVILYVWGDGPLPVPDRRHNGLVLGEAVLAAGYPWGGPLQVSHGVVTGVSKYAPWTRMSDADVNPGNSGGPVFDKDGNLIAIITAGTTGWGASLSVCLPIKEVVSGLQRPAPGPPSRTVGRGRDSRNGLYRPRYPAVP